jgi:hypothetical protein
MVICLAIKTAKKYRAKSIDLKANLPLAAASTQIPIMIIGKDPDKTQNNNSDLYSSI